MPMNRRQIGTTAIRQSNIEVAERNVRFRTIADVRRHIGSGLLSAHSGRPPFSSLESEIGGESGRFQSFD
jgi:hypothetical protein